MVDSNQNGKYYLTGNMDWGKKRYMEKFDYYEYIIEMIIKVGIIEI
jgi:hypothetical protein